MNYHFMDEIRDKRGDNSADESSEHKTRFVPRNLLFFLKAKLSKADLESRKSPIVGRYAALEMYDSFLQCTYRIDDLHISRYEFRMCVIYV